MPQTALAQLASDYGAALEWWRMAGVDADYLDEPAQWLRVPETAAEPEAQPPSRTVPRRPASPALGRALERTAGEAIGGDRAAWPGDLAAFHAFWLGEASIDPAGSAGRVAPRGDPGAMLMVLVGQPDDADGEVLLSGEQGRILRTLLRAMAVDEAQVYIASVLPRLTPLPNWEDLAARGLADLTRHHIALAAPRRVVSFGRGPAIMAGDAGGIPHLAAPPLEMLATSPARRQRFWAEWLEWSA